MTIAAQVSDVAHGPYAKQKNSCAADVLGGN